jgi:hypothetical protein
MAHGDKAAEQYEQNQPSEYRIDIPMQHGRSEFAARGRVAVLGDAEAREMLARVRARFAKRRPE